MNAVSNKWTEERLNKLVDLWNKKLSISKIGEELGVSRNAIAGKAHRMGLEKRQSPIKVSEKSKTENLWNTNGRGPKPLRISLRELDWSRDKCLWPSGDPQTIDFSFCGKDVVVGRPYCVKHCEAAFSNGRD